MAKKKLPTNETHGALPAPSPIGPKAFGIRDAYNTDSIDLYRQEVLEMTETELHNHAHTVGVIPVSPKSKLIASLETKFLTAKASQRPQRSWKVPTRADTDPEFAKTMKAWREKSRVA